MEEANNYIKNLESLVFSEQKIRSENAKKIVAYAKFLLYTGKIGKKEYITVRNQLGLDYLIEKENDEYCDNIIEYRRVLSNLYRKALKLLQPDEIVYKNIKDDQITIDDFLEFLKYINCYSLFETINKKGMIDLNNKYVSRSCCVNAVDLSYIFIKNNQKNKLMTLVHEMGHAYQYSIVNNSKFYYPTPTTELLSILFERMFINFLEEKNSISPEVLKSLELKRLKEYVIAIEKLYDLMTAFDNPKETLYVCLKDYISVIYRCSNDKVYPLLHNNYAFGSIASAKLYMDYLSDKDYFIKKIPDINRNIVEMSMKELLEEFSDIKPYGEYLEKTLKK